MSLPLTPPLPLFDRKLLRLIEFVALEAAQRGIDGAAGQAGGLHHVEAEAVAEAERLEDEGRGVGESRWVHGFRCYVAC